jgi:hypothetical protein
MTARYQQAIAAIDAANGADPNRVSGRPKELVYSEQMSRWLDRLAPGAAEPLRLAVRAQHIRRWEIPRDSYPMDRVGYLKWRTDLKHLHAKLVGEILAGAGYDDVTVARVQGLVRKDRLKQDPDSQTLEDVACLVFLENYFADFAKQHDAAKVIDILRKTWKKMSPAGQAAALALEMPAAAHELVEQALAPAS